MAKLISLDRLCGGALLERFTTDMAKIGRNIMDPNTDPEKNRTLTIKLSFKPDRGRRSITTSISTSLSLAPQVADETILLIGQDVRSGRIELTEYGDSSQSVSMAGESIPVKAEVIPTAPVPGCYDPETGEIYDGRPIDLRTAN